MSDRVCQVSECGKKHYAKGYCRGHYDFEIRGRNVRFHLQDVPEGSRRCAQCEEVKPEDLFYKNKARSSGWDTWCKNCRNDYAKTRYRGSPEVREYRSKVQHDRNQRLRKEAIEAYGGKCVCCSEDWLTYLELDHVDGGGSEHRRSVTSTVWLDLKNRGYPPVVQVMCANCHTAKTRSEPCKHSTSSE